MNIFVKIISLAITSWLLSIALSKETNVKNNNNDKIILEYGKDVKKVILICAIIPFLCALFFFIISITTKENYLGQQLVFIILAILAVLLYISLKNGKIIFDNNKFYSYSFFGKQKIHNFQDIIKVNFQESKGIMITFKDKSNLKFSIFMDNYEEIEKIILNSDYYKEKNEHTIKKGW